MSRGRPKKIQPTDGLPNLFDTPVSQPKIEPFKMIGGIVATTHIRRDGCRYPVTTLENTAKRHKGFVVKKLDDGEYALFCTKTMAEL